MYTLTNHIMRCSKCANTVWACVTTVCKITSLASLGIVLISDEYTVSQFTFNANFRCQMQKVVSPLWSECGGQNYTEIWVLCLAKLCISCLYCKEGYTCICNFIHRAEVYIQPHTLLSFKSCNNGTQSNNYCTEYFHIYVLILARLDSCIF